MYHVHVFRGLEPKAFDVALSRLTQRHVPFASWIKNNKKFGCTLSIRLLNCRNRRLRFAKNANLLMESGVLFEL